MNKIFADYATSTAFNLSLSRNMIIALVSVAQQTRCGGGPDPFRTIGLSDASFVAGDAIKRRGLVESYDRKWPGKYRLTRAGELTLDLLKEAGIVEPSVQIVEPIPADDPMEVA